MTLSTVSLGTAIALGSSLAILGPAAPASAECVLHGQYFATNPANSQTGQANAGCDGMWAARWDAPAQQVRGQYLLSPGWAMSSYGWVNITSDTKKKIVGDTVTGRWLRGEAYSTSGYFWAWY